MTNVTMRDFLKAALFLLIVLNLLFFPVLWGKKTLLLSSRDAPSVMQSGASHQEKYLHCRPTIRRRLVDVSFCEPVS
jgi:hypothetical protein